MFTKFFRSVITVTILISHSLLLSVKGSSDHLDELTRARLKAKPWYTKPIRVGDFDLPCSPVSVLVAFVSIFYLVYYWNGVQLYAEAAHILVPDKAGEDVEAKLIAMKAKIGNDLALFSKYAKEHSTCPSKNNGGNLGRFRKHDMTPAFDRAVFDPNTQMQTTIGPVKTQYGWHLIYVHNRQLPK